MAKRKRLTPANPAFIAPAPEVKSAFPAAPASMRAPIADVAREASSTAAVEEMAETLRRAREGGRMVISVPLTEIQTDYLVRDRVSVPGEEQAALIESICRRGQQTPIELVDLGEDASPRYGLISGWRRVCALRELQRGLGDRYAEALALLRRPKESGDAYLAMIEENEIRVGLSYYERARIALKAVQQEAFADESEALAVLYENASKAKRSKIRSFMGVVRQMDGILRFPAAIGERLGLQMAQALEADQDLSTRLRDLILRNDPADFEAEQSLIRAELAPKKPTKPKVQDTAPNPAQLADTPAPGRTTAPIHLRSHGPHQIVLEGRGVDEAFRRDLEAWLEARKG
ncbi:nuclease [Sagittula sp. S175]|uniref:nuclease n=1 Tax=Sagittula sp. S175 TaxID=3415129 RepID=UPI003C7ADD2D